MLHLKDGDFIGWAKAIFDDADHPVVVLFVPFEVEDGVDQVFQNARACNFSRFCHMPDQKGGDPPSLGKMHEFRRRFAHLRHRAGGGGNFTFIDNLNGVDDQSIGIDLVDMVFDAG